MTTITINIHDEVAREFREEVKRELGHRKGVLGKATEEAIRQWLYERKQKHIAKELIELMDEGVGTIKGWKFKREELYER